MTLRAILTAAALGAASLGLVSAPAEAKTRVFVDVGIGSPGYYYRDCDYSMIFHRCMYGRPSFYDRPYFGSRQMSCGRALAIVQHSGYRNVSVRDCTGKFYSFTGYRGATRYKVNVNAQTGELKRTRY